MGASGLARYYFSEEPNGIVDTGFVEELFGSRSNLIDFLSQMAYGYCPVPFLSGQKTILGLKSMRISIII